MDFEILKNSDVRYGLGVSPGIAIGSVFIYGKPFFKISLRKITDENITAEIARFHLALKQAKEDILKIKGKVSTDLGEKYAFIFEAHSLILEDPKIIDNTEKIIRENNSCAEYAFEKVLNGILKTIEFLDNDYLAERVIDIKDVGQKVLNYLLETDIPNTLSELRISALIVARDLMPGDTASLEKEKVKGLVTELGSYTSHTAIIARAMEIPAVVGVKNISTSLQFGDKIILDGKKGLVIVNPSDEVIKHYENLQKKHLEKKKYLLSFTKLPQKTVDNKTIHLRANIESVDELKLLAEYGAHGIGLFRTEYLFARGRKFPSEETQFEVYKKTAQLSKDYSSIIRTLDIGGDKIDIIEGMPQEKNPFLGWRAIRFCLTNTDIFKTQLRAILRASAFGNLKIMFPMISSIEEMTTAKVIIKEVMKDLSESGIEYDANIPIGTMIEIPSAVLIAESLAKVSDFFSIGTNDLIQYTLAVDRGNERVSYLYNYLHPAVLKLIKQTIEVGKKTKTPVSVCGEMAGDPVGALLLIGFGVRDLSLNPFAIPIIKEIIKNVNSVELEKLIQNITDFESTEEIEGFVRSKLKDYFKMID
ncbi:phosphoenolpyruvate--protein phosphotransferase [Candidatus Dependentiae bacterium]|nr:phosphoenolpyruvate--protein phosphotransferase [Candidatus Dependentiae bacterium]